MSTNPHPASGSDNSSATPGTKPLGGLIVEPAGGRLPVFAVPPRPMSSAASFTPQQFGAAIGHWWPLAVPMGLVLTAIAVGVLWYLNEDFYEASVMIRISESEPFIVRPEVKSAGYERLVQTEINLVRSQVVLEIALRNIFNATREADLDHLAEHLRTKELSGEELAELIEILRQDDPIEWIRKELALSVVPNSELIQVAFPCRRPKNAQRIVNSIVAAYLDYQRSEELARIRNVVDELVRAKELQKAIVRNLREELETKSDEAAKIASPTAAAGLAPLLAGDGQAEDQIRSLQSMLLDAELQSATLTAEANALRQLTSTPSSSKGGEAAAGDAKSLTIPENEVVKALEEHPEIRARQTELLSKRSTLVNYSLVAHGGEQHPSRQKAAALRKEIAHDEELLAKARQQYRALIVRQVGERVAADAQGRLESVRLRLNVLKTWLDEQRTSIAKFNKNMMGVQMIKDELTQADTLYSVVAERILRLQIESRAPDRIAPIPRDLAPEPRSPKPSNLLRNIGAASAICMCIPFALAILWEMKIKRVNGKKELENQVSLPVVGEIARFPAAQPSGRGTASRRYWLERGLFDETVDSLRTRLMLSAQLRDVQIIAVTSGTINEGKTSLAVQLAVSLSRGSNDQVLIIDGDMRSPDVHGLLDLPLEPGLAGLLSGDCVADEAIATACFPHLHVLPAGLLRTSPHTLFKSELWSTWLAEFRSRYRYIIIDTPPALVASEALVLSQSADATLIAAMRGVSRVDRIAETHARLMHAGAKPVGVVLSGVSAGQYYSAYGKYWYAENGHSRVGDTA